MGIQEIEKELEAANHALDQKQRAIRREEDNIKDLHAQLEILEKEKTSIEEEIEDLQAKVDEPAPTKERMTSPKRAALHKKQIQYDQAMEDYRATQTEVDEEVERLKVVLTEKEEQIRSVQKSISVKEDEIFLIKEKIK